MRMILIRADFGSKKHANAFHSRRVAVLYSGFRRSRYVVIIADRPGIARTFLI